MGIEIILPNSYSRDDFKFQCRLCDERFVTWQAMEAHCLRCAIDKEQEIYNASLDRQDLNSIPDIEWEQFNRRLRQQGIDPMTQYRKRKSMKRSGES